jgi:hydrogenase nickel incorporation protein HypA/HybF
MHELSIALAVVDVAVQESARQGGASIVAVHVQIGPLSGVVPEALRSAFELARQKSDVADAKLVIEETPLVVFCPTCDEERELATHQLCCPVCGSPTPNVVRGRELEVVALEIES